MTDSSARTLTAPREVRLVARPVGWPTHDDFELAESAVPELGDGQLRVRNVVMSVDPYMRGRMSDAKSYAAPFALDEAMQGGAVGHRRGVARRRVRRRRPCPPRPRLARGGGRRRLQRAGGRHRDRPGLGLPRRPRDDRPHRVRGPDPDREGPARRRRLRLRGGRGRRQRGRPDRQGARGLAGHRQRGHGREGLPGSSTSSGSTPRSTTRTARSRSSCARPLPTASTCTSTTSVATTSRRPSGRCA